MSGEPNHDETTTRPGRGRREGRIVYFSLTATGRSLLESVLASEKALA